MTREEIYAKYPKLFRQVHLSEEESMMYYGAAIDDGWLDLLDQLSTELNELEVEYAQIKEKFGELRVYLDILNKDHYDKAYKIINKYEEKSSTICESCGKPGKITNKFGWLKCMCDECIDERIKKENQRDVV